MKSEVLSPAKGTRDVSSPTHFRALISQEDELERVRPNALQKHTSGDSKPQHAEKVIKASNKREHPRQKYVVVVPAIPPAECKHRVKHDVRKDQRGRGRVLGKPISCAGRGCVVDGCSNSS